MLGYKRLSILLLAVGWMMFAFAANDYVLSSPNGKLKIRLTTTHGTCFEVWCNNQQLLLPSSIGLRLSDGTVVGNDAVTAVNQTTVNGKIDVPFGKNRVLNESYNQLVLSYGKDYDLVVRAYNEGLAYRFITNLNREIVINDEDAVFNFAFTPKIYFPECDDYTAAEKEQSGKVHQIHQGRPGGRLRGGLRAREGDIPVLQIQAQRRAPDHRGLLQDVPLHSVHARPRSPRRRRPRHGGTLRGARRVLPEKAARGIRKLSGSDGIGGLNSKHRRPSFI